MPLRGERCRREGGSRGLTGIQESFSSSSEPLVQHAHCLIQHLRTGEQLLGRDSFLWATAAAVEAGDEYYADRPCGHHVDGVMAGTAGHTYLLKAEFGAGLLYALHDRLGAVDGL